MYIHGTPTGNVRRGIALNSGATAVIYSYVSDIHETGSDSQALCGWNGTGPFKILGNHLEAAGENVMFGGSDPSIKGAIPSDVAIEKNRFHKPLSWKPDDPSYAGINWSVKNLLEFKNAQRVLVKGNKFEHNWPGSQNGWGILFTPRNQGGGCGTPNPDGSWTPLCGTRDITFQLNEVENSYAAINIMSQDTTFAGKPSFKTARVLIENNLFWKIDAGFIMNVGGSDYVTIRNNTFDGPGAVMYGAYSASPGAAFTDNLVNGYSGIGGDNLGTEAAISFYWPGIALSGNALWGPYPGKYDLVPSNYGRYQAGNAFPADRNAVKFTDPANGNYRLQPSSPYLGKGADIDAIKAATAGVSP
jgi:hypothetical protein